MIHNKQNEEVKPKIFWLTGDNYFDVDYPIVPKMAEEYCIDWHIFLGYNKSYNEDEILSTHFPANENLKVSIHKSKVRARNPKRISEYLKLIKTIKAGKYNIIYIDMFDMSYLFPLLFLFRIKKIVYACHDFDIHVGFELGFIAFLLKKFNFRCFKNFQFFSKSVHNKFIEKYPKKNTFMARLALKDFGESQVNPPTDKIVFTYFGTIRENKGVEYLIEAGNSLYETYKDKFIINILGHTSEWLKYDKQIKNREAFNLDIRGIENHEIPNVFCSSHFIILPYKDVSQSGVLHIAYNYYTPAICPDFDGFREYIDNNETGYLFEPQNSDSLKKVMEKIIIDDNRDYPKIKSGLNKFIEKNISSKAITKEYIHFFNKIIYQ